MCVYAHARKRIFRIKKSNKRKGIKEKVYKKKIYKRKYIKEIILSKRRCTPPPLKGVRVHVRVVDRSIYNIIIYLI